MVLQHAHTFFHMPRTKLEGTRIVAVAGAITLNIAVLMLLMMPMSRPTPAPIEEVITPPWVVYEKQEKKEEKKKVEEATIVKRTETITKPKPTVAPTPDVTPITDPIVIDQGTLPLTNPVIDPIPETSTAYTEQAEPVAGVQLEYQNAAPPPYPRIAIIEGLQGTVFLEVLVDVNGKPIEVKIHKSSGHRVLDEAAKRQVLSRWTFRPATKDGHAVQAIGIVPVEFKM